ncbi:pyridoxal phosphate-dependent aminotransferase [Anaerotruncus rubiinfantis]|jgi:histidinol-phosphate aminotransferase|uniref:pyridoxal phosphate-dependent aminotransferase n=1 Tax=Anaerotruncus rubiinfantis TaxID=1720200 RepID=UPI0009AD35F6|nr:histidinol-phosphate transaminase [Anaerotruncus rubiinfantis]
MYELPEKLKNLTPYAPVTGQYRIRLDANESYLTAPGWLRQELAAAIEKLDFNRYPDPYTVELCQKFADFFDVLPSQVVAGNGSDELIGLIVSSFTSTGEDMVVVNPDFSMYSFYAQMNGVRVHTFQKPELALDADALIAFAKERAAKLVVLSNPCNPTSLAASQADVLKIVEELSDRLVVIDEAYMDFAEGSILRIAPRHDNLIVLKTCSKAFGMAAIRLGFAVAGTQITLALKAAKSPYNVNSMTQAAGCVLLSHPDYLRGCTEQIKTSRTELYQKILALAKEKAEILEVADTCANFVFLQMLDARRVFDALSARGIIVRLMAPRLRITAGTAEENREVVGALREILD